MSLGKYTIRFLPKKAYLAAGLALRLFLAPFLSHPFDMRVFMAVGAAVSKGLTPYGQYVLQNIFAATPNPNLYGTVPGIGYPPLWGLICGDMYSLASALASNNLYAYVFALKIPIILAELGTAVLIYNILKNQMNEKIAQKAFVLFAFCPYLIAVGTVWGMFDIIAVLFAVISAYILYKNWALSSVFLAVASLLKVFPIILAPLYSILLYRSTRDLKTALGFFLFVVSITGSFTLLPMVAYGWPTSNMYNALSYQIVASSQGYDHQASFPYGAASPFNVFTLANNVVAGGFQPPWILVYAWIPACIAVYILLLRARMLVAVKEIGPTADLAVVVQWSLVLLLVFFTTRAWVSEQNLAFLLTFMALSVFIQNPQDIRDVRKLWLLLFAFVLIHVPVIAFFWMPFPWTLNAATAFANGPFGWTRLLLMTLLTLGYLSLSWHYVVKKLRWW